MLGTKFKRLLAVNVDRRIFITAGLYCNTLSTAGLCRNFKGISNIYLLCLCHRREAATALPLLAERAAAVHLLNLKEDGYR